MNAQTILNAITAEKEKFLAQYEDKSYFKKKISVLFNNFMNNRNDVGLLGNILSSITVLSTFFGSMFLSIHIIEKMKALFNFDVVLGAFIASPFVILFTLAALKITVISVFKWKYKMRKNNDFIAKFFSDDFYDSEASPEIKNMLKLLLSEDQYFKLREGKPQITYKDAQAALDSIIERESVIEEKHEVFLSPEEIKKYSYVNAG